MMKLVRAISNIEGPGRDYPHFLVKARALVTRTRVYENDWIAM
jgi:hypothetical protein